MIFCHFGEVLGFESDLVATKGEEQKGIYRVYRMDGSVMPRNSGHRGARPTEEAHAFSTRHARLYDSGAQGQSTIRRTCLQLFHEEAHASDDRGARLFMYSTWICRTVLLFCGKWMQN